jgi:hypothetical protein
LPSVEVLDLPARRLRLSFFAVDPADRVVEAGDRESDHSLVAV